jgi:hypothetical protein
LNCVGFFAIWSDTALVMQGAPGYPGSTFKDAIDKGLSTLKFTAG